MGWFLMPDQLSADLLGTAAPGRGADRSHVRRAGCGVRIGGPHRAGHVSLALAAAALALLGLITACGSAAGQPPSRIPPRASLFRTIPAACSLMDAGTASLLGLNAKGKPQSTAREPGVTEEYCDWTSGSDDPSSPSSPAGSSASPSPSGLTSLGSSYLQVIVDLFTAAAGQAPAAAAQAQLQQNVSTDEQANNSHASPVAGLADGGFIEYVSRPDITESLVQARDQNVLIAVVYGAVSGSRSGIDSQALTGARAVLASLAAS
jgi:hypothetical protein